MKHQTITFMLTLLLSMVCTKSVAHDIAMANADGKTIYYVWINNHTELVVSYSGTYAYMHPTRYLGNIVIPDSVTYSGKNYPVTSIGEYAFSGCSGLTSITIPNSVTSIGNYAFRGCSGLTSITIPNSVTSIGEYAFSGCSGLTSITIGNSVTSIGYCAFDNTAWYKNQPNGLVYAGKVAYIYKGTMPDNTKIILEDGTLGIGYKAFYGCSGLTFITIPNSVTSIEDCAFFFCSGLTSITIPYNVTSIGERTFENCSSLNSITIPNSVTSIGSRAFHNCTSLTSVHISDLAAWCNISLSDFDSNPLEYAHHLYMNGKEVTNLVIPEGLTSIRNRAFSGCSYLTSVTIPNSVTSIGGAAFYKCI